MNSRGQPYRYARPESEGGKPERVQPVQHARSQDRRGYLRLQLAHRLCRGRFHLAGDRVYLGRCERRLRSQLRDQQCQVPADQSRLPRRVLPVQL